MADGPDAERFELEPSLEHAHEGEAVAMELVGDMIRVDPRSGRVSGLYRCPRCDVAVTLEVAGAASPRVPVADIGPGHVDWDMRSAQ